MEKDLLAIEDLSQDDFLKIILLAKKLKQKKNKKLLKDKTLAMIFAKSSTRTRVSFETGMFQLGGHALNLNIKDIQLGRGESLKDTAKVLSRYVDAIMIRTHSHTDALTLAEHSTVPVINGLTDYSHPCQVLADFMTIQEHFDKLDETIKVCFIGDPNNMANSLIMACKLFNMKISIACPKSYSLNPHILNQAKNVLTVCEDPLEAAENAHVLITDVWSSMGYEDEIEKRKQDFKNYQINDEVCQVADPKHIVLHCLPAHLGEEITEDIFNENEEYIFNEAENRLHVQKAILSLLIKNNEKE